MFISLNDIQDRLLKCDEQDIVQANQFIKDTAIRMGVNEGDIQIPLTFTLKRLAVCFACYNRCLACVGMDPTVNFDGGNQQDVYEKKLALYKTEIDRIVEKLTEADFTGKKNTGTTINLWRA